MQHEYFRGLYVQIFTRNVYKVGGEVCTIAQPKLDQSIGVVSQGLSAPQSIHK
jgi:hypothetical protein